MRFGHFVMISQSRGQFVNLVGKESLQRLAYCIVQLSSILLEQRLVGRVLHERMAQQILQLRLRGDEAQEASGFERVELTDEIHFASSSELVVSGYSLANTCSSTFTANCRPMTEATRNVCLTSSGNRSMRASSRPCKLSGISTAAISLPATQD